MSKSITIWIGVVGVLVVLDIGLRLQRHETAQVNTSMEPFRIEKVHTNDTDGIVIVDRKTSMPLWGAWSFGPSNASADTVSFFFGGKNIIEVIGNNTGFLLNPLA